MKFKLNPQEVRIAVATYVWEHYLPEEKRIEYSGDATVDFNLLMNNLKSIEVEFKKKEKKND